MSEAAETRRNARESQCSAQHEHGDAVNSQLKRSDMPGEDSDRLNTQTRKGSARSSGPNVLTHTKHTDKERLRTGS